MYTLKLADIYDAIYQFKDYRKDADYLLRTIRAHHQAPRTLLETACGTGLYLALLRPSFTAVEGMDLSGEMLDKARERLPGVPLHQGNMSAFDLGRSFDVVCCLFRSIGYVKTRDALLRAIQAMSRHLGPGGVLVIEPFFTPDTYWVNRVTLNEYKTDQLSIAWMYLSERIDRTARFNIHYLVGTPNGVDHFTELHEFGLFDRNDYEEAFAAAGLDLTYDAQGPSGVGLYVGKARNGAPAA